MKIQEIICRFHIENDISADALSALQNENDATLRKELITYTRENKDRAFALALLDEFVYLRKETNGIMSGDHLMLACFNLGLHNEVEDCLKVWEAKNIDFDTFCYIDIQLLPFAGVDETIVFLKQQSGEEAASALKYLKECAASDDFDDLSDYYSPDKMPWFI